MTEQEKYARIMQWCARVLIGCAIVLSICAVQLVYLALTHKAHAQGGPVQQGGPVTPGHIPVIQANGVIGDGGSAQNGNVKEIGLTNTGTPFCINDAPTTGPFHQLCLGANSLGNGLVSYQAYNGAPVQNLLCNINGVIIPCELSGSNVSNIPGPLSVAGNITTPGTLTAGNITTPGKLTAGSASIGGLDVGAGGLDVAGGLAVSGNAGIAGNLVVQAPGSVFSQGLVVKAASGQIDAMQLIGGLEVDGPMLLNGALTAASGNFYGLDVGAGGLEVAAGAGFTGDVGITGQLVVDGPAFVQGVQVTSDKRLKSDISDFRIRGIEAIRQLRPVSFRFGTGRLHVGLIADEVRQVVPQAVGDHNGIATLDPMALIDVLIVANRELAERVEALEKRVSAPR